MNLLPTLAAIVAPVFLIALGGYVWARTGQPFDHVLVTRLITIVGAPALVFSTLAGMTLSFDTAARMAAATVLCLLVTAAAAALILRLAGMPLRVYLPSLIFPNVGNAGLPVCLFAFGQKGMALAMVFFTVTSIGQFALGPAIAAGHLNLKQLLKVPLIHAVIAAMAMLALGLTVPLWASNTLNLLAGMTIPLMLLSLGVAMAELRATNLGRAAALSLLRLGLGAACGWAAASAFGLDGTARGVAVIESSMPAAVFNYLFARLYGNEPGEVAGVILVSTLMSVIALPLILTAVM
ncbi:MAG: AEC family transporter [Rhodomicrobium sp.]